MANISPTPPAAPEDLQRACVELLAAKDLLALGAQRAGRLVHVSAPLADLLGLPRGLNTGSLLDFVAAADRERVRLVLASAKPISVNFLAQRSDGSYFEAELAGALGDLPGGDALVFALTDSSRQRRVSGDLSYAALHDAATGLPNLDLFRQRMRQAAASAQRAGRKAIVLVAQLEGVSDARLLRAACARLRKCLRDPDTLARIGDREIAILLARVTEREHAVTPAARLVAALVDPIEIDGRAHQMHIRLGIAAFPDDSADPDEVLDRARVALGEVPGTGGQGWAFVPPPSVVAPGSLAEVPWEARFEVGIEVIDGQHRHLLALINRLSSDLRAGRDLDPLVDALKDLVRYTEHHFATEERLMDEVGAAAERHRAEHRRLEGGLARLTLRLDPQGVSETSRFLLDWLFHHIDEVDRPFAALLRSRGIS